ncbi:hypothetical protein JYU34_001995 [Plutella xylostella]|uniref:Uncharacterized protein n=1 Tax=Plutella xylostella TaxID=51655 RepID=A0ABQ7R5B2_PLUXY|nr:hypothetical protein JYU34_001995 [Plutella xylostella]
MDIQYQDLQGKCDELEIVLRSNTECQDLYEAALTKICSLEHQLAEAHTEIQQINEAHASEETNKTMALYNELVTLHHTPMPTIDLTTPSKSINIKGANRLKKYIKINKYIRKSERALKKHKTYLPLKKDRVRLQLLVNKYEEEMSDYNQKLADNNQECEFNMAMLQSRLATLKSALDQRTVEYENQLLVLRSVGLVRVEMLPEKSSPAEASTASPEATTTTSEATNSIPLATTELTTGLPRATTRLLAATTSIPLATTGLTTGLSGTTTGLSGTTTILPRATTRLLAATTSLPTAAPSSEVIQSGSAAADVFQASTKKLHRKPTYSQAASRIVGNKQLPKMSPTTLTRLTTSSSNSSEDYSTVVYSDRLGKDFGHMLGNHVNGKVVNYCYPELTFGQIVELISERSHTDKTTIFIMVGNSLGVSKSDIHRSFAILEGLPTKHVFVCAFPYSCTLPDKCNYMTCSLNKTMYNACCKSDCINFFDTNLYVDNFKLTWDSLFLSSNQKRRLATEVAHLINSVISIITKKTCVPIDIVSSNTDNSNSTVDLN